MTTHASDRWMTTTEYRNRLGFSEFVDIIDSLGRRWNPLLHPRDRHGRFIRTFSFVNFNLPDGTPISGRVSGINQDGNLLVKVAGVGPGAPQGLTEGSYVEVPHDQVDVQTIKAQIGGRGSAGTLNGQESRSVARGSANLRRLGLNDQADKLDRALQLANTPVNRRDPSASQAAKDEAVQLFREVGEALGAERGKGFAPGTDYHQVKGDLSSSERARLQTLDQVMGTTFTARHSLGDRAINDVQNDEGPIHAKKAEVRLQAAQNELQQDFNQGIRVWDMTSGDLKETTLQAPVHEGPRDTVSEQQGQAVLPALQRSTYQKLQTGLSRLSGWKQAQQVAPGDRFHVDKNGDEVVVGHIVQVDPTKSRAGFTGIVSRIYTDAQGGKHVYARDFDPDGSKGYAKGYKDYSVQGGSIELADEGQQSAVFQQLAHMGAGDASKALIQSFTADYLEKMRRRYASPDAKRISPTGGFFDVAPVQDRIRSDANGESLGIGHHVMGPNGDVGVVTYIEPNENTVKVQYPNGQQAVRISSRKLLRLHGPQSEVYLKDSGYGENNYIPTREEAARIAEGFDAQSVADAIRKGGSPEAIQTAMSEDPNFQKALSDTQALFDRRDQSLSAGKELSPEDRNSLHNWDRMAAASAGQFREGDTPPTIAKVPEPTAPEERPGNPANPEETVSEGGVSVRSEGDSVIVGDNTEDPIPSGDTTAVDEAVKSAEEEKGTATPEAPPEEPAPRSIAERIVGDLKNYAGELNYKDSVQQGQVGKYLGQLDDAITNKDGEALVKGVKDLTNVLNQGINRNLRGSKMHRVLNGAATNGTPLHEFLQGRLDSGADLFGAPQPVTRAERPEGLPNETPEGVDPKVDSVDNAVAEALTMDDGSTLVMQGDQQVNEGFYVVDPKTVTEYDHQPTTADVTDFLNENAGSPYDGLSVWFNEDDGRYRMAKVEIHATEQDARDSAVNSESNQYVNIADGMVYNVTTGGDPNAPAESVADPRSEDRVVRTAGTGRATARTTSKQKGLLDHVAGTDGAGPDIQRIADAVKNGEEITGADASQLADYVDGLDATQFDKPSDKGVASQLAHRLARASGEEGARGYSSQNTALRRTSDVGISLTAQSQDPQIRELMANARNDIKNGDYAAAAEKFRLAGARFNELGLPNDAPSRRAAEHADRLDAMGGTTGPAAQGAPGGTPEAPPTPEGGTQGPATAREALDAAGLHDVQPLTQGALSNPDTPRTREVTPQEYATLALGGQQNLGGRWDNATEPLILRPETFGELQQQAWDAVQTEWGGLTVKASEAQINSPTEGFAITVKQPGMDTVSVPIGSDQNTFFNAMQQAASQFGMSDGPLWMDGAHLGIFRNEDTGNYEIDPVLVVDTQQEAEQIGAYTNATGGAYNFGDGNGYWPPYVAEGAAGGGEGLPEGAQPVARPDQGPANVPGVGPPGEGGGGGPGEPGGGPGGPAGEPESQSVVDALQSAESYLESETQAEHENGPQGWTPALEDINAQIDDLRKMLAANPNDTAIATELRALAGEIEGNFRLTDPSTIADELRKVADGVDAGTMPPDHRPEAGGGEAPFQASDPEGIRQELSTTDGLKNAEAALDKYREDGRADYQSMLSQVEEGSLANREVNLARGQQANMLQAADDFLYNIRHHVAAGSLTPDHIEFGLSQLRSRGIDPQSVMDIFNGHPTNPYGSTGKIDDFMAERLSSLEQTVKTDGNEAGSPQSVPTSFMRANFQRFSSLSSNRMENGQVGSFDEYGQMVDEMNAISQALHNLTDPKNRAQLNTANKTDIPKLSNRLNDDAQQAQRFFAQLREDGFDPTALETSLKQQLDRFNTGGVLDDAGTVPQESWLRMNKEWSAYQQAIRDGEDTERPAFDVLVSIRSVLASPAGQSLPHLGDMMADQVRRLVVEQMTTHDGQIPDATKQLLRDPVFHQYGALADVTQQMDMEDLVKSGEIEDLRTATGGRYDMVQWDTRGRLDKGLVTDDRPDGGNDVLADIAFRDGMEQITPNVANALNSMWASVGGGIHRTSRDITEADIPDAERWKDEAGWARGTGSDVRDADEVGGVYTKSSNNIVVADSVLTVGDTNVVVHESGHALDSMLGDLTGGAYFSQNDREFNAARDKILELAQYGDDPNQSLMHWYFRNESEGADMHNGPKGTTETWAESYAAYTWGLGRLQEMQDSGVGGQVTRDTIHVLVARQLTKHHGDTAIRKGDLSFQQRRDRELKIGQTIFEFWSNMEEKRLPKLMSEGPKPIPVNTGMREFTVEVYSGENFSVPGVQQIATRAQRSRADTHNSKQHGTIQMQPIERGSPEWAQMEAAVKEHSPNAGLPSPTALYVTWNPDFPNQGVSVIWKAVMPNSPDKPTTEYTDAHKATQLAAKFQRQQRVNDALEKVHGIAEAAAFSDETAALVLALIETGMRVGSSEKAGSVNRKTGKRETTFGGATMQVKHVFFPSQSMVRFKFPGKAGKPNTYESRNPELRRVLQNLVQGKKPSDQVFAGTNADRTIQYLREHTGIEDIINHDTRTRYATNLARELVAKIPKSRMPKNEAEFKKWVMGISKTVGAQINDTWQVARDSYISPAVWEPLERSAGLPFSFDDSPPYVPGITPGAPPVAAAGQIISPELQQRAENAAAEEQQNGSAADAEPQAYALDESPQGQYERRAWYESFAWPAPPIVAAADVEVEGEEDEGDTAAQQAPPAGAVPEAPAPQT